MIKTRIKKRRRKKILNILLIFIVVFLVGISIYSISKIFLWNDENKKIKDVTDSINKIVIPEIKEDTDETIIVNEVEDKTDIYWDYIKTPFLAVKFDDLLKTNKDTVAWIKVGGTYVNYPVVQALDNDYYLNHDFNKNKNGGGWIYLDYRNNINSLDRNNVIYGHSRYNQTMFGTLKNVLSNKWLNNTDNHIIQMSSEAYNYVFQVFSVYETDIETYYLKTYFETNDEFSKFINTVSDRSIYNFNASVNENDKILTLSTCNYDSTKRIVVHAKLLKQSPNN